MLAHFPKVAWLNPAPEQHWQYTQSTQMIRQILSDRMYPMTLKGLEAATRELSR